MTADFRTYLFPEGHPRIAELQGMDVYAYQPYAQQHHFTGALIDGWKPLYRNDFCGITSDGAVVPDLFRLTPAPDEERAPVQEMVDAARALLALLDEEGRARLCHQVDAPEWQTWANPEFLQFDTGLRLELLEPRVRAAVLALVEASLSPHGYQEVRTMMGINGFLGDVVGLPGILNEFSYNFALYGEPDLTAPWGWHLYGHHCVVNCLVVEGRMVISPVFLGAEPNEIDEGPLAGTTAFTDRIALGRQLLAALDDDQRARATTYAEMVDPDMPPGRVHPGDERHLAGAFQDNRVIPYEGVQLPELTQQAQELVWQLLSTWIRILPAGPYRTRMEEVRQHRDDTWFSWIGGHGPDDPYYLRVQSPVVLVELDHHCGVFLTNEEPAPFHIHTTMRTPNGNDYGRELVRQWQSRSHGGDGLAEE